MIDMINAKIAIPKAPNQPTSKTDLKTNKIPIKPRSKPSIAIPMTENMKEIIVNIIKAPNVASMADPKEECLLKNLAASQIGTELMIQDIRKKITRATI